MWGNLVSNNHWVKTLAGSERSRSQPRRRSRSQNKHPSKHLNPHLLRPSRSSKIWMILTPDRTRGKGRSRCQKMRTPQAMNRMRDQVCHPTILPARARRDLSQEMSTWSISTLMMRLTRIHLQAIYWVRHASHSRSRLSS